MLTSTRTSVSARKHMPAVNTRSAHRCVPIHHIRLVQGLASSSFVGTDFVQIRIFGSTRGVVANMHSSVPLPVSKFFPSGVLCSKAVSYAPKRTDIRIRKVSFFCLLFKRPSLSLWGRYVFLSLATSFPSAPKRPSLRLRVYIRVF